LSVFESTSKLLKRPDLDDFYYQPWACWFPNGKKILFSANEHNSGTKLYVQDLKGKPKCITSDYEGIEISSPHSISPDGKLIAVIDAEQRVCLYPTKGGKLEPLNNLNSEFLVVRWSEDGKSLFIRKRGLDSTEIYQYELTTNKKRKVIELAPKDKTGIQEILRVLMTPNGESYAYSYTRELSDLFILESKHWNYNSTLS
jgi:Tol biopolymer transport system component